MQRIVIGCIVAAIAALAIWHPAPRPPQSSTPAPSPTATAHAHRLVRPSALVVYVAGAVMRPGLYQLHPGDRVADAVRIAGGLLASADPLAVNLAARVRDGDEVAVPKAGSSRPIRRPRGASARTKASAPDAPVDVNAADASALARVPGIGPTIAQRIVEVRERDGPYAAFDELLDVAGMTPSRLERASQYLIL